MSFFKKYRSILTGAVFTILVLTFAFFYGAPPEQNNFGDEPEKDFETKPQQKVIQESKTDKETKKENFEIPSAESEPDVLINEPEREAVPEEVKKVPLQDETVLTTAETPEAIPDSEIKKEFQCTLTITCKTAINNSEIAISGKTDILPDDGIILNEKTVSFNEGESVFDILLRETKASGIHMEFMNTPGLNAAYIEGIGNLYEFDAGALSGWMYKVNGIFPNFSCSQYILKNKDVIEWIYTCDLGKDIGGRNIIE